MTDFEEDACACAGVDADVDAEADALAEGRDFLLLGFFTRGGFVVLEPLVAGTGGCSADGAGEDAGAGAGAGGRVGVDSSSGDNKASAIISSTSLRLYAIGDDPAVEPGGEEAWPASLAFFLGGGSGMIPCNERRCFESASDRVKVLWHSVPNCQRNVLVNLD